MKCTNAGCEAKATRIMPYQMATLHCMWVAPYCPEHPGDSLNPIPVGGPALSANAQKIAGGR